MKVFEKLLGKIISKKHSVLVKENDVLTVLEIIHRYRNWFINTNMSVERSSYDNKPYWLVKFNSSDEQWSAIVCDLDCKDLEPIIKYQNKILIRKK